MYVFYLVAAVLAGYLLGSVNSAVIVTRIVAGEDIRRLGNKNAGAANVGRSIGRGWGTLVFFFDLFKGVAPMLLARWLVFPGDGCSDILAIFAVGIAAVGGHCRPVYFRFAGGGGMATSLGVFFFYTPVEFLISVLAGALFVLFFIKKVQFRMTRWTPICFVTLTPFLTLAVNSFVDVPLFGTVSLGGHPGCVVTGTFALSLFILAMNLSFVLRRIERRRSAGRDGQDR